MSLDLEPRAAEAAPAPSAAWRLPWHLRKRFVLPVGVLLLVGVLPSLVLQAAGIAVLVSLATGGQMPGGLEELRRSATGASATPEMAVDVPAVDDVTTAGDVGEAAPVTYVVAGDLDGATVTWITDAEGSEQSEELRGDRWEKTVTMDATWQGAWMVVERPGRGDAISCSIVGPLGDALDEATDSGAGAMATCAF